MNPLFLAALAAAGVGAVAISQSSSSTSAAPPPGTALDPGMDHYTGAVVSKALAIETDPTILSQLASDLSAAGFVKSAKAVADRSRAIKTNIQSPTKGAS